MTDAAEAGFVLTTIFGVAIVFATLPEPVILTKPKPKPQLQVERPFQVAWNDVEQDVGKKADRVVRIIPLPEKQVLTERIVVVPTTPDVPASVPSVAEPPLEDKPVVVQRRRHVALRMDVCARHGQRKVMVGRYRWRCQR